MTQPAATAADRNLLFGILAVQTDLITRDALIKAMNAWVLEKAKPLGQILLEQGAFREVATRLGVRWYRIEYAHQAGLVEVVVP